MKKILILLLVLTSAACANSTTSLWQKRSLYTPFQESIHAIYISEESEQILFFGTQHHYVLQADPLFQYTLHYGAEKDVQYSVNSATVYPETGKALVSFSIKLEPGKNTNTFLAGLHEVATEQLASWANQPRTAQHIAYTRAIHGLEQAMENKADPTTATELKISMHGKFYQASHIVNQAVTPLQIPFQLQINQVEYTRKPLPVRIALTPFSVASDGVLTVGAIALGVTAVTILAITQPDIKK